MRFYTNVQMVGDNFLVRGYEDGRHFMTREKFNPTLFVPANKKTKYQTLNGEYVESVQPGSVRDCREFVKKYENVEEVTKNVLDIEMNYFTPLVHHLVQKHIKEAGKETPMYFSGYEITKLTQGSTRTALIYAGKDEVKFSKEEADMIKYQAAVRLGLVQDVSFYSMTDLTKDQIEEGIKRLAEFKRKDKYNLDRVLNAIMELSNNKPIETGAIYNAMTQIPGVKLVWQQKVPGIRGNTGGYLVDLTNYNYNQPMLFGLDTSEESDFEASKTPQNKDLFVYLSDQLLDNFNYVNPGFTAVPSIKDLVNRSVVITQTDINNKKLEC